MMPAAQRPDEQQEQALMLRLSTRRTEHGAAVLSATGEIDLLTVDSLRAELDSVLAETPALLVLDLGGVSFLASCGLAALVELHRRASAEGVPVRLVSTARSVTRPLSATGLLREFTLFDDVRSALA
ncbi:anti-anti-sigma factor [Crossiella equi]|uniref:Anti-sigma factor antagonist n=1 Tax=Crossiella equi TaxID=130796 RepID=A0ABS5A9H5_9PSEU|nr:STAS domain-containing protein [Crossiella equi]MBP2473234.1 anti-anti-sigma factor [Crossiella equi]